MVIENSSQREKIWVVDKEIYKQSMFVWTFNGKWDW